MSAITQVTHLPNNAGVSTPQSQPELGHFSPVQAPLTPANTGSLTNIENQPDQMLQEAKTNNELAKKSNVDVAKSSLINHAISTTVAGIGFGAAIAATVLTAGATSPLLIASGVCFSLASADAGCAFADWHSKNNGGSGLAMGGDAIANTVHTLLNTMGVDAQTSKCWSQATSITSRVLLTIATLWAGAIAPSNLPDSFIDMCSVSGLFVAQNTDNQISKEQPPKAQQSATQHSTPTEDNGHDATSTARDASQAQAEPAHNQAVITDLAQNRFAQTTATASATKLRQHAAQGQQLLLELTSNKKLATQITQLNQQIELLKQQLNMQTATKTEQVNATPQAVTDSISSTPPAQQVSVGSQTETQRVQLNEHAPSPTHIHIHLSNDTQRTYRREANDDGLTQPNTNIADLANVLSDKLNTQVNTLIDTRIQDTAQLAGFKAQINYNNLAPKLDTLSVQLNELVDAHMQDNKQFNSQLAALKAQINNGELVDKLSVLSEKIDTITDDRLQDNTQLAALQAQSNNTAALANNVNKQLSHKVNALTEAHIQDNAQFKAQLAAFKVQINHDNRAPKLDTLSVQLNELVDARMQDNKQFNSQLAAFKAQINNGELVDKLSVLSEKIDTITDDRLQDHTQLAALQAQSNNTAALANNVNKQLSHKVNALTEARMQDNAQFNSQLAALKAQTKRSQSASAQVQDDSNTLRNDLSDVNTKIDDLATKLTTQDGMNSKNATKLYTQISAQLAAVKAQSYHETATQRAELIRTNDNFSALFKEKFTAIEKDRAKNNNKINAQLSALQAQINNKNAVTGEALAPLTQEMQNLQANHIQAEMRLKSIQAQLENRIEDIKVRGDSQFKALKQAQENALTTINHSIDKSDVEIALLNEKIALIEATNRRIQTENKELTNRLILSETRFDTMMQQLNVLEQHLNEQGIQDNQVAAQQQHTPPFTEQLSQHLQLQTTKQVLLQQQQNLTAEQMLLQRFNS